MRDNQMSRYGAIAKALPNRGPQGKVFFVIPAGVNYLADFQATFPNDGDGVVRVYTTIQDAHDDGVSSTRGDVILAAPGTYVENVTISKDNVSFISTGIPGNSKRVSIAPTSGIALIVGDALRFQAVGIRTVGVSAVGTRHSGEGAHFEDCDFTSDTSHGFQFYSSTTTADYTGSGTTLLRCLFRECGGAGLRHTSDADVSHINYGIQATNVNVWGCQFYGNTGDDIDDDAQAGSPTYFNQWDIAGNKFMTRNKTVYLDMDGGTISDCLISGNFFADDGGLNATKIALSAGAVFVGNFQAAGVVDGSTF